MKHFVKYENWWWEVDENTPLYNATLYNMFGGKNSGVDITGLEIVEAQNWRDLDWKGTPTYGSEYKTGWLSPDGKFYGCDYRYHDYNARFIHGKTEDQLEQQGWVKIACRINLKTKQKEGLQAIFACRDGFTYPTNEQIKYVREHYAGKEKEEMLLYLCDKRMQIHEQIQKDWGMDNTY